MDTCDVLIVGGGPGGSACAWQLRRSGLDVLVMDKAEFPRDKVCAGWITPQVLSALELDLDDYRHGRTLQPINGFRVGIIGHRETVGIAYGTPVSYGIRRCEFDTYLLRRSGARLSLGAPVVSVRRENASWIVNESVKTPMVIGAAGHFCPIARRQNRGSDRKSLVAAQEAEFAPAANGLSGTSIDGATPELYFSPDLNGYGWCFRKQQYLNLGYGQLEAHELPQASRAFAAFLKRERRVPNDLQWEWRGHAYLVSTARPRRVADAGVLLVGDAAGLAHPRSGEGIRPAIESGLLAGRTIIDARGDYATERLQPYVRALDRRFGHPRRTPAVPAFMSSLLTGVGRRLLRQPSFVRHIVVDRWFLNRSLPHLTIF